MRFAEVTGNADVAAALAGMVSSGRIPHAIMFNEDDGGGAIQLVQAFLQMLYCRDRSAEDSCGECPSCNKISKLIHPDVNYVFPVAGAGVLSQSFISEWRELVQRDPFFTEHDLEETLEIDGKSSLIAVGESKSILDKLSLSALEGGYRSVVIYLPEKMNKEAANRLLKMIEEPPQLTQFLLITHAPEKVLTTIASRCQLIRVMPRQAAERTVFENPEYWYDLMDALVRRDLLAVLDAAEKPAGLKSRESAKGFCKFAGNSLRQLFLIQQGLDTMVTAQGEDLARLKEWAGKCRRTFPRGAIAAVSNAQTLVERNVNLKILFTDLADRLSTII